ALHVVARLLPAHSSLVLQYWPTPSSFPMSQGAPQKTPGALSQFASGTPGGASTTRAWPASGTAGHSSGVGRAGSMDRSMAASPMSLPRSTPSLQPGSSARSEAYQETRKRWSPPAATTPAYAVSPADGSSPQSAIARSPPSRFPVSSKSDVRFLS